MITPTIAIPSSPAQPTCHPHAVQTPRADQRQLQSADSADPHLAHGLIGKRSICLRADVQVASRAQHGQRFQPWHAYDDPNSSYIHMREYQKPLRVPVPSSALTATAPPHWPGHECLPAATLKAHPVALSPPEMVDPLRSLPSPPLSLIS